MLLALYFPTYVHLYVQAKNSADDEAEPEKAAEDPNLAGVGSKCLTRCSGSKHNRHCETICDQLSEEVITTASATVLHAQCIDTSSLAMIDSVGVYSFPRLFFFCFLQCRQTGLFSPAFKPQELKIQFTEE